MNKTIFYAHAGSGNHGCEAIVRSSQQILGNKVILFSKNIDQDIYYKLNVVISNIIEEDNISFSKYSYRGLLSRIHTKLTGSINQGIYFQKKKMFDSVDKGDVAFSVGGDNYCYPGTEILAALNYCFKKKKSKTVLWGCSVEPDLLNDKQIAKDISRYDLITARESISYNALKEVNANTVLVSDPAFVLNKVDLPLPNNWKEGNTIGINVSPLVMDSSNNPELVYESFVNLIQFIINDTDCNIALIPHVVWESNDDRKVLNKLYDRFENTDRVTMIQDHNCMELKGYISRCRFFVGARTHATIAAYSTCVPTLVLGYSIKSIGIAKDLFGTSDNYVLPVQSLSDTMELVDSFKWLMDNEHNIKNHLIKVMPEYRERAYIGKKAIENLLNKQ
ncbi:MAG: polysaccharide pyruvyl transferase family protein [Clostridia bacterium]|nr:polysaccharide pyruvyl transferase family protein [Clostridia bacterium]